MAGTDDLAPLLTPGQSPSPYAQGVIKQWNPESFENVVRVHERDLVNLPVKSGVDALTYQPGHTVILARWPGSRQGMATWWIDGRVIIPGEDSPDLIVRGSDIVVQGGRLRAADDTGDVFRVDPSIPELFMRPELITDVARQIVGDAVEFDSQPTSGSRSGGSFGTFGTITGAGPEVDFTVVNGSFLALWGAQVDVTADVGEDVAGWMDLDVDGPTPSSPPDSPSVGTGALGRIGASAESGVQVLHTSVMVGRRYVVDPGDYTVEALYRTDDVSGSPPLSRATWQERFLLVIAF